MTMLYGYVENKFGIVSMPLPFMNPVETKKRQPSLSFCFDLRRVLLLLALCLIFSLYSFPTHFFQKCFTGILLRYRYLLRMRSRLKKDSPRCLFALILGASYSFWLCASSSPSIHSLRIFFKNASREFFFGTSTFYGRDRD